MDDVQTLLKYVTQKLPDQLNTKTLGDEYFYQSLTLAAIDAVYSARAKYPSVQSVVQRYCNKYEMTIFRSPRDSLPPPESQERVTSLIQKMEQNGISLFSEQVFKNSSITSGRLKAEILLELLKKIEDLKIQNFQDIQLCLNNLDGQQKLIRSITEIRGIGEATFRYFLMLAGDEQMAKPDTMILRFIQNALGRNVLEAEAVSLIQAVSKQVLPQYPNLNPRLLDYLIWSWQRSQSISKNNPISNQKKSKSSESRRKQKINTLPRERSITIPQKTQQAMFKRYPAGELLSSSQIKDDVLADYPDIPRSSVMPADYCCNKSNNDPLSGIYHIFFFEQNSKNYRLLPKRDITRPRQRGTSS